MTEFRYRLHLTDEKDFDEVLYLRSEHAFLSPIGTRLFYLHGCEGIELMVVGYYDDFRGSWGPKCFCMCLKDVEFEDDGDPMLIHDDARSIADFLMNDGWELRE